MISYAIFKFMSLTQDWKGDESSWERNQKQFFSGERGAITPYFRQCPLFLVHDIFTAEKGGKKASPLKICAGTKLCRFMPFCAVL